MRIKNLFLALLALPLMFVACNEDKPVDEVKDATVTVTAGTATENTLSFTVASTNADKVAYLVVEGDAPTASEVLTNGTAVDANKSVELTATELKAETKYTIVAAAQNSKGVVKNSIEMTTLAAETPGPGPGPGPDTKIEFVATNLEAEYSDEEGHIYGIMLGDKEFGDAGWGVDGGTYFTIYILASSKGNGVLPNGQYALGEEGGYTANTIIYDYSFRHQFANGTMVNGMELFKEGYITISDGKIDGEFVLDRDDSVHHVVYEGDLSVDDGGSQAPVEFEATHTADKWLWGGSSNYGNKYQVVGEGFSVDVHLPAQFAQEYSLTAGDYIWTSTTMFGYNDFENEFTTRSLTVNGTSVAVDAGNLLVANEGEEYHIEMTLVGRDGFTYMIEFNGKLNEKEDVGGSDIVITSLSEGEFNSSYGWYTFKGSNDTVTFDLIVNDYQSTATSINAGNFSYAPMKSFAGSEGYFFVDNFKMDGIKYKPQVNSTLVVTNDGDNVGITLNLFMDSGDELVVVYNGPVGEPVVELPKLATPSVAGLVSGNAATVSWQEIAGAKDYTVTLNGTDVQTVDTAYVVYQDLAWETTYTVSVVANPADATVNAASDAGTASFTTEADPNGGGDEPENPGDGGEDDNAIVFSSCTYLENVYGMLKHYKFVSADEQNIVHIFMNSNNSGTATHYIPVGDYTNDSMNNTAQGTTFFNMDCNVGDSTIGDTMINGENFANGIATDSNNTMSVTEASNGGHHEIVFVIKGTTFRFSGTIQ